MGSTDCNEVVVGQTDSICCRENPKLGQCEAGKDDGPDGKCTTYCQQECRGGICKHVYGHKGDLCHCYC